MRPALRSIGVDAAALDACIATAATDSAVARDVRTWMELKMESVPSLVINGHLKTGGLYPSALRTIVRELVSRPS